MSDALKLSAHTYIATLSDNAALLADTAEPILDRAVPSCPDWTVGTLVGHLGMGYAMVAKQVAAGTGEDVVERLEDIGLPPPIEDWARSELNPAVMPPTAIQWFRDTVTTLADVLRAADPTTPAWTWFPPDQTAGFWMRRMAHETLIHHWDVEATAGEQSTFDPELAADGVDEALTVYMPTHPRAASTVQGSGESYHFHCTDTPGEWVVRFEGPSMSVNREHARADVALRGPAADLFLFLWHRIPADRLEIRGDAALVPRYFEFVPPD